MTSTALHLPYLDVPADLVGVKPVAVSPSGPVPAADPAAAPAAPASPASSPKQLNRELQAL